MPGAVQVGRQYHPVFRCIGKRVIRRVNVHQKIEGRFVELLNDDFALDQQLLGGRVEAGDRNRIVLHVAMPAQAGGRRDFQGRGLDPQFMPFSGAQAQNVGLELHHGGKIVIGAMENLESLHAAFYLP